LARDQTAVNSLQQGLANERPLDRAGLDQIENRPQRSGVLVAWSSLYIASGQIMVMKHHDAGNIAIAPEVRRNRHMQLCRVQVRQIMQTQRGLVTIDPLDLFLPVSGPERPEDKIRPIRRWEQREAVNAAMFSDPVTGLYMIGMRIFGESGRPVRIPVMWAPITVMWAVVGAKRRWVAFYSNQGAHMSQEKGA
jgi:hypothetical protein